MFVRAALLDPQAPFETQRQAHIQEFQHINVVAGILLKPRKKVKKPIATHRFTVKGTDHGLQTPTGLAAPRRIQHHVIQSGAQSVARGLHRLSGNSRLQRPVFEGPDL